MALRGGTVVLVVLLVLPARAGSDLPVRRALQAASVVVETTGCAGVVAENPQIIVTAKHCVKGRTLRVRLSTGSEHSAWVVAVNDASDQAVLFLEEPVDVEPLAIVRRRQIPGTVLYFEGNPAEPRFQSARLDRIGHCPSLPDLPDALFTSIDGRPGDSGAPLVDGGAEIVGLVHGGARCHIATPAGPLARLVDHVLGRDVVETTRTGNGARISLAKASEAGVAVRVAPPCGERSPPRRSRTPRGPSRSARTRPPGCAARRPCCTASSSSSSETRERGRDAPHAGHAPPLAVPRRRSLA